MAKVILLVLLVAALLGAGYFYLNFEWETHYENGKLAYLKIAPRAPGTAPRLPWQSAGSPPARPSRPTIRIASFNLDRLDEHKLSNRRVSDVLLRAIPQFEIIALQGLQGQSFGVLLRLVEQINAITGRQYGYAALPPAQRDGPPQYSAFVFDLAAVEIDRSTLQAVPDPAGRFRWPPLVALFRVRGPGEAEAFTFELINVRINPDRPAAELDLLADVYRAVRDGPRNEDDVILLGDLGADENHLGRLGQIAGLTAAITSAPTTVRGTRRVDNILFDRRATVEFTGRAEVLDLMRECDLTIEAAQEVSAHLPVWAEFSSYEGGQSGHTAPAAVP
jgi:hypothetical protein